MKLIYRKVPVLIREATARDEEINPWIASFHTMYHMTNDAGSFMKQATACERGDCVPLFDPKMAQQFNHRAADLSESGHEFRKISKSEVPASQLANADYFASPLYYVEKVDADDRLRDWRRDWLLGFKDVTGVTSTTIGVFAVIPRCGVSNKFPLLLSQAEPRDQTLLLGNLNAFTTEFVLRLKFNGLSLNYFYVKQLPILGPDVACANCGWDCERTVREWLGSRVLETDVHGMGLGSVCVGLRLRGPAVSLG